jgi:hypothetical protein
VFSQDGIPRALSSVCGAYQGQRGGENMMSRQHRAPARVLSDAAREREVRGEIENFLNALSSYPDRFARDPYVSFEEHLFITTMKYQLTVGGDDRRRSYGR